MGKELTKRERKVRIRKGLPIEACGLQFYPITMADYGKADRYFSESVSFISSIFAARKQ